MEQFKKRTLNSENFSQGDNGISINKLLTLIEDSPYYGYILEYFAVDSKNDELIEIKGANTLFTVIKALNKKYSKVDLISNLKNIHFNYVDGFSIKFSDLTLDEYFNEYNKEAISAKPIHSGERDFFSNLYDIDKYAGKLISKGYRDILDQNLELLKSKEEHIRKYRLLHDVEEDCFYLRAIVSEGRYYNYDNSITLVIALLKLHFETQSSGVHYSLDSCEFNESFIRIFFKTSEQKELTGVGFLENTLQVSNDEIKREALRFSNVCSISFKDSKDNDQSIFIKPKDIKSKVLSIPHGTGPDNAFKKLEDFVKSKEIFQTMFEEVQSISKIKDHNQILHLVRSKIEKSTTEEIKRSKEELMKILLRDIKSTTQLLETFSKLMLLEGLEIDAKEYLRYLIYEALIERK
jgi:hypothetical protein